VTTVKKIPTAHKARSFLCYLPITMELNVIKVLLILRSCLNCSIAYITHRDMVLKKSVTTRE